MRRSPHLLFIMKILLSSHNVPIRLAVVCCVHGNERYGLSVFQYFQSHIEEYPGLKVILANEPALEKNVRFIATDLNRSFPGSIDATNESRLAALLLQELVNIPLVLDIHTTTSEITLVPIVTQLHGDISMLIHATDSQRVVLVTSPMGDASLIAHVASGVSLEYGDAFAGKPGTLQTTIELIAHVLFGKDSPQRNRDVFSVTGVLKKTVSIPPDARNFTFLSNLGVYPVLLHERAYTDLHALAATKKETLFI